MSDETFLDRVLKRVPQGGQGVTDWKFQHWAVPGKPTDEALGMLPVPGVIAEKLLGRVMAAGEYKGPIPHVTVSRAIDDPAYVPPQKVRFYQKVSIPIIGDVQQENVLELIGEKNGWQIAAWHMLEKETGALSTKDGIRSQYNDGAWLVAPGVIGYALSSAPRREDVGFLKWKALTAGADVAAAKVIKDNILAMARWAEKIG